MNILHILHILHISRLSHLLYKEYTRNEKVSKKHTTDFSLCCVGHLLRKNLDGGNVQEGSSRDAEEYSNY